MSHFKAPVLWSEVPVSKEELCCIYSALILVDDDIPVTADKIKTLLQAANIDMETIWPSMLAKAVQGLNVRQLIQSVCRGPVGAELPEGGGSVAAGAAAPPAGEKEEDEKEEVKKEEEEDSSDEDFGLSLFD